ncbi:MAG: response regulator [Candidatus Omnitrophota bacterium]|jgi:CheY-like chemotaxis protein
MKKILIVDDDKDICEITKKRLTQAGYETMAALSGQEAISICQANHPDLVLLDIAMPDMDGYLACEKIRQDDKTKDIPVLFVTGKGLLPKGIDKHCQDLGASGYISKPFQIEELLKKITDILGT